jgi:hypothetical protein
MRILVLEPPARDQRADLDELVDHRPVGRPVLALVVIDAQPREEGHVREVARIGRDRVRHLVRPAGGELGLVLEIGDVIVRAVAGAVCTKPVPASSVT